MIGVFATPNPPVNPGPQVIVAAAPIIGTYSSGIPKFPIGSVPTVCVPNAGWAPVRPAKVEDWAQVGPRIS